MPSTVIHGFTPLRSPIFVFSSRRRHTRYWRDWSSDVCSSDLDGGRGAGVRRAIGSRQVPIAAFANLWSRLGRLVGRNPAALGFGLMNEPVGMNGARAWEAASRAAVRAIRAAGSSKRIFVQSYFWGGAAQFPAYHPRGPWINDANTWYEAHQYFDRDRSARYALSYDQEIARARRGEIGRASCRERV